MRSLAFVALAVPTLALAEEEVTPAPEPTTSEPAPETHGTWPPPVAAVEPASDDSIVEVASVTTETSYGRKGTFELGASTGMMLAPGFRNVNFAPMLGWFVGDNFEVSAIFGVSNIKAGDDSTTVLSSLVEPSYHVPLAGSTFGFIGMGVGVAYVSELGTGLEVAPRIGLNVVLGRNSVLTPSFSYEYTTHNTDTVDENQMENVTLAAVSSTMRINIGYTAMW